MKYEKGILFFTIVHALHVHLYRSTCEYDHSDFVKYISVPFDAMFHHKNGVVAMKFTIDPSVMSNLSIPPYVFCRYRYFHFTNH